MSSCEDVQVPAGKPFFSVEMFLKLIKMCLRTGVALSTHITRVRNMHRKKNKVTPHNIVYCFTIGAALNP